MSLTALEAPIIVLNSYGFCGAETLASFLAPSTDIGLLPGQNFIQQDHALYRPLLFPQHNANACFDILATKQFTKSGVQWAGLGKFMSPEYAANYAIEKHRELFNNAYALLSDDQEKRYVTLIKLYCYSYFLTIGEDPSVFSQLGFYGSNVLLNASAYDEFFTNTHILQVKPSPSEWLSLASQSRTWNPENALTFYVIQNLFINLCELRNSNIHSLSYSSLIDDTQNTIDDCCRFLRLPTHNTDHVANGRGHAPVTAEYFDKIREDATAIDQIYRNSDWYEIAKNIDSWSSSFLSDKHSVNLLERYQAYWNSTAHIAFDWNGPLETSIKNRIRDHVRLNNKGQTTEKNIAYEFYQHWFQSSSIEYTKVNGNACYPLGNLENTFALPRLQYFLRIAIHYLHTSAALQGEQLHSYRPANESRLYQTLCEPAYQRAIERNWLSDAFNAMQLEIDNTQKRFTELQRSTTLYAEQQIATQTVTANNTTNVAPLSTQPASSKKQTITEDEINAIAMSGPDITNHERSLVADAMSDWYEKPYYYCEEFERRFAAHHNREYALMTPSCTTANHLLLAGLGIGAGDEVLVPECTWIATATPTYHTGAQPVYCDINADDWCISLDSMEQNLTPSTRAIIVVNLYGNMAKMEQIELFAKKHNLYLIEDAAESIGARYKEKKSGAFGVGSVFSFHRTKTLTTGEGGMLLIDDKALFERCVKLRDHGRGPRTPAFTHETVGFKYMPFNVQAALGLGQLDRLDALVDKKRHILHYYKDRLKNYEGIQFNVENEDVFNGAWCSTLVLNEPFQLNKPTLMGALNRRGIPTRPFFYPLSSQPAIRAKEGGSFNLSHKNPVAHNISKRGINLPSALNITDAQLDYVCTNLTQLLDADLFRSSKARKKAA